MKFLMVPALAVAITGCATISNMERTTALTDPFADNLRIEYVGFGDYEFDQGDVLDGVWYAEKINMLFDGEIPAPVELTDRNIPTDKLNELAEARNKLMAALSSGSARSNPMLTAKAQANFDCWVEQQEENFQPEDIAKCRAATLQALDALAGATPARAPAAAPAPVVEMERMAEFLVFFDFDSAELTTTAKRILDQIAGRVGTMEPSQVIISGHADRAGALGYNQALSERRAKAVKDYLAQQNVPTVNATLQSFGELKPRVPTADGVAEPGNRYVNIIFLP